MGLICVDSGATYRAAALRVLESRISPDDERAVSELIGRTNIEFKAGDSRSQVLLDGEDVTQKLRSPEVTLMAAKVSRIPEVRNKLTDLQRSLASGRGLVMEGRDIGTVVFPNAPLKIFLKADPTERARRR